MTTGMGVPHTSVLLEQLPLVTYVAPIEARWSVDYVSPQIEALLGFAADDFVAEPDFWLGRVAAVDRELFLETWTAVRGIHDRVMVEYRLVARDGCEVWVRDAATVVTVDGLVTIHGFITDINREKQLELELARERAQTDAFFRDSSIGMAITDAEGRFVRVNEALAHMNSLSVEEHVGLRLRDISAAIADDVEPLLEEVWRTGKPVQGRELTLEVSPGETATSLVSYFPVDAAGAKHFGGIVIDITDLRRALDAEREAIDALRQSEEQFRAVFDNAHDAMVIADDEGRYIDVNPAACELYGLDRDALLALSVADIARAGAAPGVTWQDFLDQGTAAGACTIVRRDGTQRETEFAATASVLPGRHLSILRDVTERTRLERGLREAQKLESVGTLAAGVAHDFNNMLTAIGGYSQLLLARLAPGTVERSHAEEIERAADRAAKLTAQLLAFGRRQVLQPRAVDLNALVAELSLLLSRIVGPEVVLSVEPEDDVRTVSADPAQLEQVVWNLVVNAADAMPGGGRVALRTRNVDVEHDTEVPSGALLPDLAAGPYVELSISDSGYGMDADTLEHVFEPFFTTKEVGLGEGLGLSTAYGIIKQSGGTIAAESLAGSGSTFRIYLPAASAPATRTGDTQVRGGGEATG